MHIEFAEELQRRLHTGELTLSPAERALIWRHQSGRWLQQAEGAPPPMKRLIYEAVELIDMAATLAEHDLESTRDFARIAHQLNVISDQLSDWVVTEEG